MVNKSKCIRVDEATWERLTLTAVKQRSTIGKVVESMSLRPDERPAVAIPATANVPGTAGQYEAHLSADEMSKPVVSVNVIEDRRCGRCQERWKDHQGGKSGTLAVRTNCRTFQEPV